MASPYIARTRGLKREAAMLQEDDLEAPAPKRGRRSGAVPREAEGAEGAYLKLILQVLWCDLQRV